MRGITLDVLLVSWQLHQALRSSSLYTYRNIALGLLKSLKQPTALIMGAAPILV